MELKSPATLVRAITWMLAGGTPVLAQQLPDTLDAELLDGVPGLLSRLQRAMTMLNSVWPEDWSPESLIDLVQTGRRITLNPRRAMNHLGAIRN